MPVADITFDDLTKWFVPIEKTKIQSGENTADYFKIKEIHLKVFNSFYGETLVRNFMDADLRRYKAERRQKDLSKAYIDQEVYAVKLMIRTAFNNRKVDGEALRVFTNYKPLMKKKTENRRTRVLSFDEYNRLWNCLPVCGQGMCLNTGTDCYRISEKH